jgi:hypothetical protein
VYTARSLRNLHNFEQVYPYTMQLSSNVTHQMFLIELSCTVRECVSLKISLGVVLLTFPSVYTQYYDCCFYL